MGLHAPVAGLLRPALSEMVIFGFLRGEVLAEELNIKRGKTAIIHNERVAQFVTLAAYPAVVGEVMLHA